MKSPQTNAKIWSLELVVWCHSCVKLSICTEVKMFASKATVYTTWAYPKVPNLSQWWIKIYACLC